MTVERSNFFTKFFSFLNSNFFILILEILLIIFLIYNQLSNYYLTKDPMLLKLKKLIEPLDPSFKDLSLYKGKKSYTINKSRIYLCLYDENGEYYPMNLLVYVLCHELAHLLNKKDRGHTPAFQEKFEDLIEKATKEGIFNPSIPIDPGYCQHN